MIMGVGTASTGRLADDLGIDGLVDGHWGLDGHRDMRIRERRQRHRRVACVVMMMLVLVLVLMVVMVGGWMKRAKGVVLEHRTMCVSADGTVMVRHGGLRSPC